MIRHQESELALIERLRSGDPTAVNDLASAYGPRIYQLAFRSHEEPARTPRRSRRTSC